MTDAGLFEWSMQQQGDGTHEPRPVSETDRQWLDQALKSAMVDLGKRMQDIKESLDASEAAPEAAGGSSAGGAEPGAGAVASLEEKEQLLDELMDLVENIDLARGGLACAGLHSWPSAQHCWHGGCCWWAIHGTVVHAPAGHLTSGRCCLAVIPHCTCAPH